ncbi:DUF5658 family protein [Rubinisphaera margarita]|uniref:DUF5658 family protein n=1 Tax=Rubinisphaera margarita TaxID=2909586 RepID=UPI001EE8A364|nr:DUF5658 family protein [Rubinisphaera margarita]MCG6158052.1 DUF5658 family protein [Rubinisphaera margarita]
MKKSGDSDQSLFHKLFRHQLPLESETTIFILVSALDIFMTWILLSGDGFRESNPIAKYFLDRWGRKGFVGFKFASVAVVCVIAQIVASKNLRLARLLLLFGTAVVGAVVVYSFVLWLRANGLA